MQTTTFLKRPSTSKKQVCFAQEISSTSSAGQLKFEDLKDLWYEEKDYATFRIQTYQIFSKATNCQYNDIGHLEMRGLESRTDNRRCYRYMAIRCTVSAFRRGLKEEQVASIAERCNAWSKQTAYLQACHDFCDVYKPSMLQNFPQIMNQTPPEFPFVMKMKRRPIIDTTVSQQEHRRVRRRINPAM